jgi:hypothetical protein
VDSFGGFLWWICSRLWIHLVGDLATAKEGILKILIILMILVILIFK